MDAEHIHDQRFDGDDPYLICRCGQMWDALTGLPLAAPTAPVVTEPDPIGELGEMLTGVYQPPPASAVTETDHAPGCDVFRIAESWEPYGVPRHCDCGFAVRDAKRRGVYNWTPPASAVTETDPIDAYLASPQAAEELARAMEPASLRVTGLSFVQTGAETRPSPGEVAASVLAALQKVRHPEEAG